MTKFTFNNKETYLAYRSNWKAEYKELTKQIRNAKFCKWFCSLQKEERIKPNLARFEKISPTTKWNSYAMFVMQTKATAMLEELKEAKKEAQSQYLNNKNQLIAA